MSYVKSLIISVLCISLEQNVNSNEHIVRPKCSKHEKVCEFHLTVGYKETMVYYDLEQMTAHPVVPMNGRLHQRVDCDAYVPLTDAELKNVSTADGTRRLINTINGQYPGPPIVVYEDQEVVVHVKNNLLSDSLTLHWHGLVQRGTPWMDGVASVGQCPINPEETFTYRFVARPAGTNWYHSHIGAQRTDGLAGAFIVLEKERRGDDDRLPDIEEDFIMVLQDWMTRSSEEMYYSHFWFMARYMPGYGYSNTSCYRSSLQSDGTKVGVVPFTSALINGKGHHYPNHGDTASIPELPLETFTVKYGKAYRFRVINAAMIYAFRLSVDQHQVKLVAVDGNDVFVEAAESIIIQPGERVDFLVHADIGISNYWIRAETLEDKTTHRGRIRPGKVLGVLHYEGCSREQKPRTRRRRCTPNSSCRVINCPFGYFPIDSNIDCLSISHTRSTNYEMEAHPVATSDSENDFQEIFLNFHFATHGKSPFVPSVSGKRFKRPTAPLQIYPQGQGFYESCKGKNCTDECCCTNIIKLEKNKVVQLVLHNQDKTPFAMPHPIHVHGHHFHVLKMVFPEYDRHSGRIREVTPDIECDSEHCNYARWSNRSWHGDNIPGLNLKNPPLKDTIIVPRFGYTILRFKADNPGYWFMHCHIEIHQVEGMALVLQEGNIADMPPLPRGFKRCGNFDWSLEEFSRIMDEGKANAVALETTSATEQTFSTTNSPYDKAEITDDLTDTNRSGFAIKDPSTKTDPSTGLTSLESILIGVICVLTATFCVAILVIKRPSSPPSKSDPQKEPLLKKEEIPDMSKGTFVKIGEAESSH